VLFIGPWPSYRSSFEGTIYYRQSLRNIAAASRQLHFSATSKGVQFGLGETELTPPVGTPLAGYGSRKGAASKGVHDKLYAKALALSDGQDTVVITGSDLLIVSRKLADAILEKVMAQTNLQREDILFSATHTHSGPGAWGAAIFDKIYAGDYDQRVFDLLVQRYVQAIITACRNLQPGKIGTSWIEAPEFIRNRLIQGGTIDPELSFLVISDAKGQSKVYVVTYSAHATTLGADNLFLSGDYPGYLQRYIEDKTGTKAIFLSGAVGSMSPKAEGSGFKKAQNIGESLAQKILQTAKELKASEQVELASMGTEVLLPPYQLRLTKQSRLSPILTGWLLPDRRAWLQLVMVNNTLFLATPCDFSGQLALQMKEYANKEGFQAIVTSFNGDYIGYVVPDRYYELDHYETRLMSVFGPHNGSYFMALMRKMIDEVSKLRP
ncbi:MAG: neutral/alkaline non-lysosomal ceramidase N-terminal domain-containing protein, partial [Sedimentisphaerales bacterium]